MQNICYNIRTDMVSPSYESMHALSGSFSVRNLSHNIRTEMVYDLYLYESANCVRPGIASVQNISDKVHTDMVSPFYESLCQGSLLCEILLQYSH